MSKSRSRHFKTTRTFSNYKAAMKAGRKCETSGSIDMAIDFYGTALSLLPEGEEDQTRLEILQDMARLQERTGHAEEALEALDEILALLPVRAESRAETYRQRCRILIHQGHPEKAKTACEKGLKIVDDTATKAILLSFMGRINAEMGHFQKALTCADDALAMTPKKIKGGNLAHVYSTCGVIYALTGKHDAALQMFRRANRIFKREGDLREISGTMVNIALSYRIMGRQLDALKLLEESYNQSKKRNDVAGLTVACFNLGVICDEVAQYRKAMEYYGKALDIAERKGDLTQRDTQYLLARTLARLGDPAGAESALKKSIDLCGNKRDWPTNLVRDICRAVIARLHGKYSHSMKLLDKAIKAPKTVRADWEMCGLLEEKTCTFFSWKQWKEVLETAELLTDIATKHGWKAPQTTGISYRAMAKAAMPETPDEERLALLENADAALRRVVLPELFWLNKSKLGEAHQRLGDLEKAADCYREAADVLQRISMNIPEEYHASYLNEPNKVALREALSAIEAELTAKKKPYPAVRLLEITRSINAQLGSERLGELAADGAVELVGAGRGFLMLTRLHGLNVILAAKTTRPGRAEMTAIKNIVRQVIQTNRALLTSDARLDQRLSMFTPARDTGLRAILCVPLSVSGRIIGALYVDDPQRTDVFSNKSTSLLKSYADQMAPAVENARLYRENLEQRKKLAELNAKLQKKLQAREKEIEILHKIESPEGTIDRFAGLNGRSKVMQDLYHFIEKISDRGLPVLIQGESGTGKELVARAIHFTGSRKDNPFIAENCAALPETLLESELFGYTRGAFTGADRNKKGLFEIADGGTLFLDEVGDMSPGMQAKLLRVLQEGRFRPIGGSAEIKVNVRILTASNKDLAELVREGKFREDLLYRLNVISITVPALRDRREDIPLLTAVLAEDIARRENTEPLKFDAGAMRRLLMYDWPGNIRELRNMIEKLHVSAYGGTVGESDVEMNFPLSGSALKSGDSMTELGLKEAGDLFTMSYLVQTLNKFDGNITRAAEAAKISRQNMHYFLRKYKIKPSRFDSKTKKAVFE